MLDLEFQEDMVDTLRVTAELHSTLVLETMQDFMLEVEVRHTLVSSRHQHIQGHILGKLDTLVHHTQYINQHQIV